MDTGIILTGFMGMVTTVVSGWVSFAAARKKYYTEVDANEIQNVKDSLDIYKKIVDDLERRVESTRDENSQNRAEIYRLKGVITEILNVTCSDDTCIKRKFFSDDKIRDIFKEMNKPHTEEDKDYETTA